MPKRKKTPGGLTDDIYPQFYCAFGVTAIAGQILIPILRRLKAGQSIREDGPTWHMSKQGTPTMGGLMFILGIGIAVLTAGWGDLQSGLHNIWWYSSLPWCLGHRLCGRFPEAAPPRQRGTDRPPEIFPAAGGGRCVCHPDAPGRLSHPDLYIPFLNVEIVGIPWIVYMVFAAFVMVGTVNAVNLTDGVDGLATGVTIPVMICYVAVSAWYGRTDLVIVSAALAGGLSAFLIYNFHPAKVFMGDTGSLFLGGAVCGLAFALDLPLMIPIVGLIYVLEVLSDIIQVVYFKKTGGKRFFRMAPLHHHLEMGGWSETKLFCVFSGITLVLCLLAFLGVMNRYPM